MVKRIRIKTFACLWDFHVGNSSEEIFPRLHLEADPFCFCELVDHPVAVVMSHTNGFYSTKWHMRLVINTLIVDVNHSCLHA